MSGQAEHLWDADVRSKFRFADTAPWEGADPSWAYRFISAIHMVKTRACNRNMQKKSEALQSPLHPVLLPEGNHFISFLSLLPKEDIHTRGNVYGNILGGNK